VREGRAEAVSPACRSGGRCLSMWNFTERLSVTMFNNPVLKDRAMSSPGRQPVVRSPAMKKVQQQWPRSSRRHVEGRSGRRKGRGGRRRSLGRDMYAGYSGGKCRREPNRRIMVEDSRAWRTGGVEVIRMSRYHRHVLAGMWRNHVSGKRSPACVGRDGR